MAQSPGSKKKKEKEEEPSNGTSGAVDHQAQPVKGTDGEVQKVLSVDFESAISACGYGKFNYILLMGFLPATCAQLFVTGSNSYIMPAAECDLELTDIQKGLLNSAVYAGNIASGMVWGFIGDKFGRRKLIYSTFLADFIFSLSLGFLESFPIFFVAKVISGITIAGPNSLMITYLAETHDNSHRGQMIMFTGLGFAFAGVLQPALAYLVIPLQFRVPLVAGLPDLTAWRAFLIVCALPSLLTGLLCFMLPESPKFLLSQGRHDEALQILRKIYALNSGKKPHTYPVTSISFKVTESEQSNGCSAWAEQFKLILHKPYVSRLFILVLIQFGVMLSINSVRLWTPQLFALLDQYEQLAEQAPQSMGANASNVCGMISSVIVDKAASNGLCLPVSGEVYLRSVVIGSVNSCVFLFAGPLIKFVGRRTLLLVLCPLGAAYVLALHWVNSADWLMAMLSLYTPTVAMALNSVSATSVDMFPTSIRAIAVSIIIMCGRVASLTGNMILPVLLNLSCDSVFFFLTGCLIVSFMLGWLLPQSNEKN